MSVQAHEDSSEDELRLKTIPPKYVDDEEEEEEAVYPNISPACCTFLPFDIYPYLVLVTICFLTFGSYWVFDTPGAIQTQLTAWFGGPINYSNADNLTLYSVYSYPNIILAFFGGMIIDRFTGVRWGAIMFCGAIFIGQTVFSLGIDGKVYVVCVVGRFIFGLGGESLTVAQNTFTTRWFDGKVLALAFGMVVSFSRIGSAVNFIVTPALAEISVDTAVWFGTLMCALSFLMCCACGGLDYAGRSRIKRKKEAGEPPMSLRDLLLIPVSAWVLFLICVFFYTGVLTFYTVASNIMQNTGKEYSPQTASLFISIPNIVSIFASPLFGRMVDKVGRALWFLVGASLALILAHLGFLANANDWFQINPIPLMIWLGLAYSLGAASLWPILSYVVPTIVLSTAYGTMTSIQNAGLAVFPQIIGALQDAKGISGTPLQYTLPIIIFICTSLTSAVLSFVLIGIDKKYTEGRLNASGDERATLNDAAEAADDESGKALLGGGSSSDEYEDPANQTLLQSSDVERVVARPQNLQNVRRNYLGRLGIYQYVPTA